MQKRKKEFCLWMAAVLFLGMIPEFSVAASVPATGSSVASTGAAINQVEDKDLVTGATTITVNKNKLVLGAGESFQLKASVVSEDAVDSQLNFFTYQSCITVSKTGKVKAQYAGRASVIVEASNGEIQVVSVQVKNPPKKITLQAQSKTLKKGKTFQIKVILPKNTASNQITYSSSRKAVATVTAAGKVKARKKGRTEISVRTYNKKKAKMIITVV